MVPGDTIEVIIAGLELLRVMIGNKEAVFA